MAKFSSKARFIGADGQVLRPTQGGNYRDLATKKLYRGPVTPMPQPVNQPPKPMLMPGAPDQGMYGGIGPNDPRRWNVQYPGTMPNQGMYNQPGTGPMPPEFAALATVMGGGSPPVPQNMSPQPPGVLSMPPGINPQKLF